MKLDQDQYGFSRRLQRIVVEGTSLAKVLRDVAKGEEHVILQVDGAEVVALSMEDYESLMGAIEVLGEKAKTGRRTSGLRLEDLQAKREDILRLAAKRGAYNVRVFGSVARGEAGPDSDVDFLVELEPGRSLFDLGGLLMDLQALLGREVDLVTEKGLHWYIRDRVIKEAVPL